MKTTGLYLHIPFCKSKCRYCDFCSFPSAKQGAIDTYVNALCEEIKAYGDTGHPHAKVVREQAVDTVYFGGGTPTLLSPEQFAKILNTAGQIFSVTDHAEITAECNPATANADYFRAIRAAGINRLSSGAQSMQGNELRRLGRLHNADDVRKTVADARTAGFDNLSLDLMFGIPEQTEESFDRTLREVLALSPEHLSVYGLQIEEGTYFFRHQNELPLPDEDAERAMYMNAIRILQENGIFQYEISNFAKQGFESRHNLRYWLREDYIGFGLAAHSCIASTRFSNTENMEQYLAGNPGNECETVSRNDVLCETVMLGMRLCHGVDFSPLIAEYGNAARVIRDRLAAFGAPLVTADGNLLSFTADGLYVSNAILADALDFDG